MTRIADLLERDFSRPLEDLVEIDNNSPGAFFSELSEYVVTPRIEAGYERLFSALAAARKSHGKAGGIWISGLLGSGKSSFAKNLGYVLANREAPGFSASALFLKQAASKRITAHVEFLHRALPCEIFMFEVPDQPAQNGVDHIAELMYEVILRSLDYAEDRDISELEIELEKNGKLAAFAGLCLAEYNQEWRNIRTGSRKLEQTSALLHRFDPRTYPSTDTWTATLQSRQQLTVEALVERAFDLCEIRRPGKSFAFILDDIDGSSGLSSERLESLCALVDRFGKQSLQRMKAGKIPGPVWIVVTAREKPAEVYRRLAPLRAALAEPREHFSLRIDLTLADISEVIVRRVLRKKQSQKPVLRALFHECGATLMRNIQLERCSLRTQFDEDQFVRGYPYLPHLIDLSIEITAGITASLQSHPSAPTQPVGATRTAVKQSWEMLSTEPPRLGSRPVGDLVSLDKIYDFIELSLPPAKRNDIVALCDRFDPDEDYPRMAGRVAKAICCLEFVNTDLPRTTKNIAALLIQRVTEAPPTLAVAGILHRLKEAGYVREAENGWMLGDSDELRRAAASLERLAKAVGAINPRPPGWRNSLIQLSKKFLGRSLAWYTRPQQEFNTSTRRSLEETACAVDRLSTNMASQFSWLKAAMDDFSTNLAALESQITRLKKNNTQLSQEIAILREHLPGTAKREGQAAHSDAQGDRTAYIIGLFGTGRRYINELILQNTGPRAEFFRDGIRLHPGPTPMIYSGHATIKYPCRAQRSPAVMKSILDSVASGFADLIFVYRHPIDSLLTNWVWWRTFIRDNRAISGISQIYKSTDDLSADLERNFLEFKAFAEGDPEFFTGSPGPPFLSLAQFVEETELHLQSAPLALRLEDFAVDPPKEFSKIVAALSLDPDLNRASMVPPVTKPYGYLSVAEKAPQFNKFLEDLEPETKLRIERIGYQLSRRP